MVDVWCPQENDVLVRKDSKTNGTYHRVTQSDDDGVVLVTIQANGKSYEQKLRLSTVVSHYELLKRPQPGDPLPPPVAVE